MLETDKLMFEHELTPEDNIIVNYCNSRQQNSTQLFTVTCKIDNVIICMLIDPGCTKTLMSKYLKDKIETTGQVDVIVGQDNLWRSVLNKIIIHPSQEFGAIKTKLGWTLGV